MSHKRRRNKKNLTKYDVNTIEQLSQYEESIKKKKTQHTFSLKYISPKTKNQETAFQSFGEGKNLFLCGSAGTGKTYISLYFALSEILQKTKSRIIIFRSIVSSRDVGFLPGSLAEKISVYEEPYRDIVNDLIENKSGYDTLKKQSIIEFMPTSFVRGLTFDNSILILDEVQNMVAHEIDSVLTRVGKNCKVIICGDNKQSDLIMQKNSQTSGIDYLKKIANKMKSFDVIEFSINDIIRSGFVREYLIASSSI